MRKRIRTDCDRNLIDNIDEFLEHSGICVGDAVTDTDGVFSGYVRRIYQPVYYSKIRCEIYDCAHTVADLEIDSVVKREANL